MSRIPSSFSVKSKFRSIPDYLFDSTPYKTRVAIDRAAFYRESLYELYGSNPSESPLFVTVKLNINNDIIAVSNTLRAFLILHYNRPSHFQIDMNH